MEKSELLDKLAEGIAQREYSLLLGAGASVDAIGGNGRPLPTSAGLRDALVEDFKIDTGGETVTLARSYEYVHRRQRPELTTYLRNWFTKCKPSWQGLLAEFNWHRIWNFNIDDIVETSFRGEARLFRSVAWKERFTERLPYEFQQIIHLHGKASELDKDTEDSQVLVFSILEYVRAVSSPHTWHKMFLDEFIELPFLIIGARLTEEFDLAEVLNIGSTSAKATGYPSIVVLKDVTPFLQEELEVAGFCVVESDGETFVRDLLDHYREVKNRRSEVYGTTSPELARFLQQFNDLRKYEPLERTTNQDFYSGYQPTWSTIQTDDDATFDIAKQVSKNVSDAALGEEIAQEVHLICGDPGSGKSACILRVARELINVGLSPFLFRGDESIDIR